MSCEGFAEKMGAYADAELPPEEMRAVASHARSCPSCAALAFEIAAGKRAVKSAGRRYAPTADFRRKMQSQVSGRSSRWAVWLIPALAVAACALVAVVLVLRTSSAARERTLQEIADLHVSALASTNPVDVVSTDRHTVKPWFQGKLPFTFELPDPATESLSLLGGRVAFLGQAPAAQLIYQVRLHRISVFILQESPGDPMGRDRVESNRTSFRIETWTQGGLRYFVIGDAGWDDVHRVAAAMKKAGGAG